MEDIILITGTILTVIYILITVIFVFIGIICPVSNSESKFTKLNHPSVSADARAVNDQECLKRFQVFTMGCISCTILGCFSMFSSLLLNEYKYNVLVFIIGASLLPMALCIGWYKMDKYAKEKQKTIWDLIDISQLEGFNQ